MYWVPVEHHSPRMAEEILVETKDGQHMVCVYSPEFSIPWVVQIVRSKDGSMVAFYAQVEGVTKWSSIPVDYE